MSYIESKLKHMEISCREAVDQHLARHRSQLLERHFFLQQTLDHLRAGVASSAHRAATWTYSCALYQACSGKEGTQRQELAYSELFRYLYDCAYWRYRDICADVTQHALERIFRAFERVRHPGTFLAFALQQLRDAARAIRRKDSQPTKSLNAPVGSGDDELGMLLPDPGQVDPAKQVLIDDQRSRLEQVINEFLKRYPRAKTQLAALLLKHLEGLNEEEISQKLGKPVKSIYVLRFRAIQKIKRDPSWRTLAAELGIALDEE